MSTSLPFIILPLPLTALWPSLPAAANGSRYDTAPVATGTILTTAVTPNSYGLIFSDNGLKFTLNDGDECYSDGLLLAGGINLIDGAKSLWMRLNVARSIQFTANADIAYAIKVDISSFSSGLEFPSTYLLNHVSFSNQSGISNNCSLELIGYQPPNFADKIFISSMLPIEKEYTGGYFIESVESTLLEDSTFGLSNIKLNCVSF